MSAKEMSIRDRIYSIPHLIRAAMSVWSMVMLFGAITMIGGCVKTFKFLDDVLGLFGGVPVYKVITPRQLLQGLVIPHMVMLCGMGLLVGGFIFMIRRGVVEARMTHDEI